MPRILHLGLGNFHRAHQAWYTHHANRLTGETWRITGVSMTRRGLRDALTASGGAYALAERGRSGLNVTRIAVHDQCLVAAEDGDAVITALAEPETAIVTLTITEKGYHLTSDGRLDQNAPDIRAELAGAAPTTAIGLLATGLARRAGSGAPITVMSCDNLTENGACLRRAISDYARAAALPVGDFLNTKVTFPNTMVDRITPATTDAMRAEIAKITGQDELAPVLTEAFSEWIIEDVFAGPRPDWQKAGAVFTKDVMPFEARKLRCLNAAHSALAYGGLLLGHTYVHEAFADPRLNRLVRELWQEAGTTLPDPARPGLADYLDALSQRFAVREMRHRLDQIAMDGSLKMAVRIAPILQARQTAGAPAAVSALAAWLAYLVRFGTSRTAAQDAGADPFIALADAHDLRALSIAALRHMLDTAPDEALVSSLMTRLESWIKISI